MTFQLEMFLRGLPKCTHGGRWLYEHHTQSFWCARCGESTVTQLEMHSRVRR